ncbi:long-chain fatty acid--CoA ligase, partial [Francisella tularensis subsp. holarctica]|nr:long-chain fatty acid--CoA ligase [Francisella tularensis subsp. holarctica]
KNHHLRYLSVAGVVASLIFVTSVIDKLGLPLLYGIGMKEVFGYGQNISANTFNKVKIFSDTEVKILKFETSNSGKIFIKNNLLPLHLEPE